MEIRAGDQKTSSDTIEMNKVSYEIVRNRLMTHECHFTDTDGDTAEHLYVSPEDLFTIFHQSIVSYYVAQSLKKLSETAFVNTRNVFFVSFMAAFQRQLGKMTQVNSETGLQQLLDVLKSWNFQRVDVAGDGTCLFTAVACILLRRLENNDAATSNLLLQLGLWLGNGVQIPSIISLLFPLILRHLLKALKVVEHLKVSLGI